MNQDKTQLGIILAIQKASGDQLEVLGRIEDAISGQPSVNSPVHSAQSTPSEVTVSAKRRSRTPARQEPVNVTISSENIAKQLAKLAAPFKQKYRSRDNQDRFMSAAANQPVMAEHYGEANIFRNERVFKAETASGVSRANAVNEGINTAPLVASISELTNTIDQTSSEVIRIDKNGRERDSNGRFLSKEKSQELKSKKSGDSKSADGTLQEGFLKRLGSALSEHGNGKQGSETGDMAGTAAGGVMWHMARGAWDIASSAKDNAVSMNDWRKKVLGGEGKDKPEDERSHTQEIETHGNLALKPALAYPAVSPRETEITPQPRMDASKEIFEDNAKQAQIKATEKQTATLSAKDDVIIKNQEEELDLLKKIAHNGAANDGLEGFGKNLFKKLFGRRGNKGRLSRREERRNRREERRARKNGTSTEDKSPRKEPRSPKDVSTSKPKGDVGDTKPSSKSTDGKSKPPAEGKEPNSIKKPNSIEISEGEKAGKPAVKDAVKTAENTAGKTAAKEAVKDGGKVAMVSERAAIANAGTFTEAANDAVHGGEKIGAKTLAKDALKVGGKVAAKTALKAIPVIGTVAGTAWDAVDGYNDTEGQQKAFNLKDGQEATTRQKSEMSAANVAGLGGLIPLASQGLSWGANKLGLTDKTDALDLDTSDIASGIDKSVSAVGSVASSAFSAVKGLFTSSSDDKAAQAAQEKQVNDLKDAVKSGSDATVSAIDRLSKQLEGGKVGEDGVGAQGTSVSDYTAPTTNTIAMGPNGLNIGGSHAQNRNFRNNNFGNLNFVGQEGAVLEGQPANGNARFARFATPEDGFRALANQVSSYANGTSKAAGYQKLNTVQDIISKWAPPNENNTAKYIQTVSASLGVKPTDTIDTSNPQVMTKLMRAIATYEGGNPQVSDEYMQNAIGHEDAKTHKWVGGTYSKESQAYIAQNGIKPSSAANVTATGAPVTQPKTPDVATANDLKEPNAAPISKATTTAGVKPQTNKATAGKATPQTEDKADYGSTLATAASVVSEASSGNWLDKGAALSVKADQAVTGKLQGVSDQHIGFRRASSEPTLPKIPTAKAITHAPAAASAAKSVTQVTEQPTEKAAAQEAPTAAPAADSGSALGKAGQAVSIMSEASSGSWLDKGAAASAEADKYLTEKLQGISTQHIGFRRATSDLTLPKNATDIPASVREAMGSPDGIAKHHVPDLSVTQFGEAEQATLQTTPDTPQGLPASGPIPADMVNKAIPADPAKQGLLTHAQSKPASNEQSEGFLGSIGHFFSGVGHTAMNAAPGVLSAIGDIAMPAAQGMLSNVVGGLGSQLSSSIQSPILNSIASPFIQKGVSAANSLIQSPQQAISSFSMPQIIPEVTNLAKSGAGNAMQSLTAEMPGELGKFMQKLVDLTQQLVSGQKDKGDSRPDVVTHGGQKAPKRDDHYSDSALEALLDD